MMEIDIDALAEEVTSAANIVTNDGYYEIDTEAVVQCLHKALTTAHDARTDEAEAPPHRSNQPIDRRHQMTDILHTYLAQDIHADNISAGWWTNINTGEPIIETRNRPEMLMLIVSEFSETHDAWRESTNDDKLTHLPGFDVELADAAIRIYDLLGCECGEMNFDRVVRNYHLQWKWQGYGVTTQMMQLVNRISEAMEGYRKGNRAKYLEALWHCLGGIWSLMDEAGSHPLEEMIESKRRFNASRQDHKIENRLSADGKKF